jgi:butyryl-CoA dehydrogenase
MSTYLSMRNLNWLLFEVFELEKTLQAPRFGDYDKQSLELLLASVKKFADSELFPVFREMDADPARMENGIVKVHPAVKTMMDKAGELGLIGSTMDYDAGGMQLPALVYHALSFIVDAANNHLTGYTGLTSGAAGVVISYGTQALKDTYVPKLMTGEWAGTMALTEPQAGSSLSDITCEAIPQADGSYKVRGQKIWISGGDHQYTNNVVHLTLVRIPGGGPGTKGISLMVIPKLRPTDDGGLEPNDVKCVGDFQKMGQKGYTTTHIVFGEDDDCRGWLVGTMHQGLDHMFMLMNGARIHVGRHGTAIATAAYYASLQFARERPQGRRLRNGGQKNLEEGQTLIINHPDVRRMLLTQKAIAEGALSLICQASVYYDREQTSEGAEKHRYHELLELLTPMVKTYPSEAGKRSVDAGLQVLGGAGYCDEYVLGQYYRDIRIMSIYEGTTGIQSLDLLGRKIFMSNGKALEHLHEEIQETMTASRQFPDLVPYAETLGEHLSLNRKVLAHLAPLAAKGQFEALLSDATVYMELLCNIVVAWQWLKMAQVATPRLGEEAFFEAKVHTMKFFFQYELSKNRSLADILMQPQRLTLAGETEIFD